MPIAGCICTLQPSYMQKVLPYHEQIEVLKGPCPLPLFPFSEQCGEEQFQVPPKIKSIHSRPFIYFPFPFRMYRISVLNLSHSSDHIWSYKQQLCLPVIVLESS